jgi:hypothetical protein
MEAGRYIIAHLYSETLSSKNNVYMYSVEEGMLIICKALGPCDHVWWKGKKEQIGFKIPGWNFGLLVLFYLSQGLSMYTSLAWNLQPSCFILPSSEITGMWVYA